jgi:hypothetical protein
MLLEYRILMSAQCLLLIQREMRVYAINLGLEDRLDQRVHSRNNAILVLSVFLYHLHESRVPCWTAWPGNKNRRRRCGSVEMVSSLFELVTACIPLHYCAIVYA